MLYSDLSFGSTLLSRDGRIFIFLEYDSLGFMLLKYGPGQDEVSWFGIDGRAEPDDPNFISDADVVSVLSCTLF